MLGVLLECLLIHYELENRPVLSFEFCGKDSVNKFLAPTSLRTPYSINKIALLPSSLSENNLIMGYLGLLNRDLCLIYTSSNATCLSGPPVF